MQENNSFHNLKTFFIYSVSHLLASARLSNRLITACSVQSIKHRVSTSLPVLLALFSPTAGQRDIRYYKIIKKPAERLRYCDTSGAAMDGQQHKHGFSNPPNVKRPASSNRAAGICSAPTDPGGFIWSSTWRRYNVGHVGVSVACEPVEKNTAFRSFLIDINDLFLFFTHIKAWNDSSPWQILT